MLGEQCEGAVRLFEILHEHAIANLKKPSAIAIDVAWLDKKTGKLTYNANWSKMGEIVKEMNLTWGGLWKTPDKPHVQLDQVPMETQPNKEALWESDARKWAQENKVIEKWTNKIMETRSVLGLDKYTL